MAISKKRPKLEQKCVMMTCTDVDIRHRTAPLRMLCSVALTSHFKLNIFLVKPVRKGSGGQFCLESHTAPALVLFASRRRYKSIYIAHILPLSGVITALFVDSPTISQTICFTNENATSMPPDCYYNATARGPISCACILLIEMRIEHLPHVAV